MGVTGGFQATLRAGEGPGIAAFQWLVMCKAWRRSSTYTSIDSSPVLGRSVSDQEAISLLESAAAEIGVKAYELTGEFGRPARGHCHTRSGETNDQGT